jgi:lysophospholipase L1-like esterase
MASLGLPLFLLLGLELWLRVAGWTQVPGGPRLEFVNPDRQRAVTDPAGPAVPDSRLFWRMRPGWRHDLYQVGAHGYRTPPFTTRKTPGALRVVCLGDSTTFGLRVPEDTAWPRRLETLLRRRLDRDDVEVLNLGVPGYTSFQGLRQYRDEAAQLEADVVISAFGSFNDWVPAVSRTDAEQEDAPTWHGLRIVQLALALGERSRAPYEAASTVEEAERRSAQLDTRGLLGPRRVPPADFAANLRALARAAHADGARFVIVVQPLPSATLERNPIARDYAQIARSLGPVEGDLAHASGADRADGVSDGPAALAAAEHDADLFVDFCHPSAEGHRLLAESVSIAVLRALE